MIKRYPIKPIYEGKQIGWAVAAVAHRDGPERLNVRVRPFTVGLDVAATQKEAEAYAYSKMAEIWAPDVGWTINVSAMPIRGI